MCSLHLSFEIPFTELHLFIKHWSSRYDDANDRTLYDPYIQEDLSKADALVGLFKWKNGGKIAPQHLNSIQANYLNRWIEDADLETLRYVTRRWLPA